MAVVKRKLALVWLTANALVLLFAANAHASALVPQL
jgi:hypothetical protein